MAFTDRGLGPRRDRQKDGEDQSQLYPDAPIFNLQTGCHRIKKKLALFWSGGWVAVFFVYFFSPRTNV